MTDEVDIIKLRDVVRGNWKAIEALKKQIAELMSGATGRKRYIEASHSDSIRVEINGKLSDPVWCGLKSGIEIDADLSGKELAKVVNTQEEQVKYFVKKRLEKNAKELTAEFNKDGE